jgi:glycosyltransferase involved in cell wall biosynthesis
MGVMRIGIASEWIGQKVGGPERYAANLIKSILSIDSTHRYELIVTPSGVGVSNGIDCDRVTVRSTFTDSRWYYVPVGLPWNMLRHPVDVLHATFSVVPWCPTKRIVLTVHDICADVHPEFFLPSVRFRVHWLLSRGMERASLILVPTEASRREILDHYPGVADKIRIIPYGVDPVFPAHARVDESGDDFGETSLTSGEFILYVGRFHVRKNLERLLEAFSLSRARREGGARLVLVGRDFWNKKRVLERVSALGLDADVLCPGHVSDEALESLYRRAKVFAFPSVHEGFGFPPLEAMARGAPVLACGISAMPEVLGDAALLVDPYDSRNMAEGLDRLFEDEDLRASLVAKGRERVKLYSWEDAARATVKLYEELADGTG